MAAATVMRMVDLAFAIDTWMTLPDASQAARISRVWLYCFKRRLRRAFSVSRVAGQFFSDPIGLHRLMASRDVLLTGIPVLDLFDERYSSQPGGALEILVESPMGDDIVRFLTSEGYHQCFQLSADEPPAYIQRPSMAAFWSTRCDSRWVRRVDRFAKHTHAGSLAVDVVWTMWTPALTIIGSDNTLKMTFLTWDKAYCLFPKETLQLRIAIVLSGTSTSPRWNDYARRGYRIMDLVGTDTLAPYQSSHAVERRFADDASWVCRLYAIDLADELVSPYDWALNGFEVRSHAVQGCLAGDGAGPSRAIRLGVAPLHHESLNSWTYGVSIGFRMHFLECVGRLCASHGMLWRYTNRTAPVNDRLPGMYASYMAAIVEEEAQPEARHGAADSAREIDRAEMVD